MRAMTGIDSAAADQDVFTPANTVATLERACRTVGLDAESARLLRLGSNAVYRLRAPVVARISRKGSDVQVARKAVNVARWLESVDYPSVRALGVDQPIAVDGRLVTFWESLSDDGDDYASVREFAEVLVRLHELEAPADLNLPALSPFGSADHRINTSTWLNPNDRAFLFDRLDTLRQAYAKLGFELPQGVIHGDANVGNVIRDQHGRATVIDLDGFAIGPREWDLALTAIYYERFGWHSDEEYEKFVSIYGFDVMEWVGYPTMRDVRELLMVTWLSQKADEDEKTADEARKRITALRTGASRRDWRPY